MSPMTAFRACFLTVTPAAHRRRWVKALFPKVINRLRKQWAADPKAGTVVDRGSRKIAGQSCNVIAWGD